MRAVGAIPASPSCRVGRHAGAERPELARQARHAVTVFLQYVDILACWVLMLLAGVALLSNGVYTWRQLCGSAGLLIVFIGCLVGAVVVWGTGHRTPWGTAQRVGCGRGGVGAAGMRV